MKRIIGGAVAAGIAVFGGANAFDDNTTRDETGEITEAGGLGAFAMEIGDCFQMPTEDLVESVEAVPCTDPHDAQVYAKFDMPDGVYPGDAVVTEAGDTGCLDRFAAFVGKPFDESSLYLSYLFPTMETWDEPSLKDREIVCVIVPAPGEPLMTQDMQNSRL